MGLTLEKDRIAAGEFVCCFCGESFEKINRLKRHRITHSLEERVLTCELCGKVFKGKKTHSPFVRHMQAHDPQYQWDRFWSKVDQSAGPDGCWPWTRATSAKGYGKYMPTTSHVGAHRVAYEYLVGPIPDGLELDHLCRNVLCCNPAHLEPVTHQENMRRAAAARVERKCEHCDFTTLNLPALLNHVRWKHPKQPFQDVPEGHARAEGD